MVMASVAAVASLGQIQNPTENPLCGIWNKDPETANGGGDVAAGAELLYVIPLA